MRKLIGVTVLSAIALSLPQAAQAQRRATSAGMGGAEHELGVDIGVAYTNPSNLSGGITIQTPFDVRFGIVPSHGNLMWEPRVTLNLSSVGGTTTYLFTPDVNVLISNSPGGHRRGMYFTRGAGLVMGDVGVGTRTPPAPNGGIGWGKPDCSAARRGHIGVQRGASSTKT